jgi:lysyl-tRNA synthetase class 2
LPRKRYQSGHILQLGKWVEPLQKLGYTTVGKLREVEKPTRLHQEMIGFRKKNKLDIRTVTPEEVKAWIEE